MDPNAVSQPAGLLHAQEPQSFAFDPELQAVLRSADRRLQSWLRPPNWSSADWSAELRQLENIAAWHAAATLATSASALAARQISNRIIARVRTSYRREWSYSLHIVSAPVAAAPEDDESVEAPNPLELYATDTAADNPVLIGLREGLELLSPADRSLLEQLFIEGRTEAEVASSLGISQRAVSKRKQRAMQSLREILRETLQHATTH